MRDVDHELRVSMERYLEEAVAYEAAGDNESAAESLKAALFDELLLKIPTVKLSDLEAVAE